MNKNSLVKKSLIFMLFTVVVLSLFIFPKSGRDGLTNIFQLIFRQTVVSSHKEEVTWQAMGSTVAQNDDEEEYFSLHANMLCYYIPFNISLEIFVLFIFYGLVIFTCIKYVFSIMSGPLGGNSPPVSVL